MEKTFKEKELGAITERTGGKFKNKKRTATCTFLQNCDWVLENIVGTNRKNGFKKMIRQSQVGQTQSYCVLLLGLLDTTT